jgi:hypothetical protein
MSLSLPHASFLMASSQHHDSDAIFPSSSMKIAELYYASPGAHEDFLISLSSLWLRPQHQHLKPNKCEMSNGRKRNHKLKSLDIPSVVMKNTAPTIVKRKRSVSRIYGEDSFPALLFHDEIESPPVQVKPFDAGGSPTSVVEDFGFFDHLIPDSPATKCQTDPSYASEILPLPDCTAAEMVPQTPPAKPTRPRKWSSFHEEGRDWGTSECCDSETIEQLLAQFEVQEGLV